MQKIKKEILDKLLGCKNRLICGWGFLPGSVPRGLAPLRAGRSGTTVTHQTGGWGPGKRGPDNFLTTITSWPLYVTQPDTNPTCWPACLTWLSDLPQPISLDQEAWYPMAKHSYPGHQVIWRPKSFISPAHRKQVSVQLVEHIMAGGLPCLRPASAYVNMCDKGPVTLNIRGWPPLYGRSPWDQGNGGQSVESPWGV